MLKKIAITCAGFVISGQSLVLGQMNPLDVPAQPPAPQQQEMIVPAPVPFMTFIGEISGTPVVLQVRVVNGAANGHLIVGSDKCPLSGKAIGAVIDGNWQSASGKSYPFRAKLNRDQVTLETNGKSLTLRPPGPAAVAENNPLGQDAPPQLPPQQPVAPTFPTAPAGGGNALENVAMKVGQNYTAPLPAGWRMSEDATGVFLIAPDGSGAFGVVGMILEQGEQFVGFANRMVKVLGVPNPTVLSSKKLDVKGGEGIEYVLSFTTSDGVKRTGVFRVVVITDGPRPIGMVWHAAAPASQFDANIGKLMKLATSIQMNPQQPQQATGGKQEVTGF